MAIPIQPGKGTRDSLVCAAGHVSPSVAGTSLETLMTFVLSQHSLGVLATVHADLQKVAQRAIEITSVDFGVIHGLRTPEEEARMVAQGASTTMHSRHLPGQSGFACAIDVVAYTNGQIAWEPVSLYQAIALGFKQAAIDVGVPIEWGGDWKTFKDYGHFQLPWASYP